MEEALQLVGITDDLNVRYGDELRDACAISNFFLFFLEYFFISQTDKKDQSSEENQLDEAAALEVLKSGDSNSGEVSDDLEAILENNLHLECGKDDFDFDLNSPLSNLLDDTEELDLLNEMMIQPSTPHFQHPRQPSQNYAHCVNSYRQNGYQVRKHISISFLHLLPKSRKIYKRIKKECQRWLVFPAMFKICNSSCGTG